MVAHVLKCPNASNTAKKLARKLKQGVKENVNTKKRMREDDTEDDEEENARKKRHTYIPNEIKFLRQLNTPFTDVQVEGIRAQIEKATVSANLPGGWFENLEVIKLFNMIHETTRDVMPSRQQDGGESFGEVDGEMSGADKVDEEDEEPQEVDDEDEDAKLFKSWYRNKSGIFQQALMHAMDIVHHPERINQTYFRIECKLHPDHENRDKYRLHYAFMKPLDAEIASSQQEYEGYQSVKELDEQLKSRGQIGAILVRIVDMTNSLSSQWWPLAIPYTTQDAQKILKDTKWGNVWWRSRLDDILEAPESSYEFVGDHAKLPDHLLRDTPMIDFESMNKERFINDPNCEFFDGDPRCDYTGRHIAFEEGDYTDRFNELLTHNIYGGKEWLERNQSAGRIQFVNGILYKVPDHGVVSNHYYHTGSFQSP
ncbi:hypothetical protein MPER_12402 [Moniliophthora perniciosa FA553]|nr:hypothetical protein MPER_12402 [Moniliophthora perniciosa FA553]